MHGMVGFWDFLTYDQNIWPKFNKLVQKRAEHRKRVINFKRGKISQNDIKVVMELLEDPSNITRWDIQNLLDHFGVKNKVNDTVIAILNESEIRNAILELAQSVDINSVLRVVFMDFSDRNLSILLENQNLYILLDRVRCLLNNNENIKQTVIDKFCEYYNISNKNKETINKNLNKILRINFLKDALAYHKDEISHLKFCIKHPKLAIAFM